MNRSITQILELLCKPSSEIEALTKHPYNLLNSKKPEGMEVEDQQSLVKDPSLLVRESIKEKGHMNEGKEESLVNLSLVKKLRLEENYERQSKSSLQGDQPQSRCEERHRAT